LDQLRDGSALSQNVLSILHTQTKPCIDTRREREGIRKAEELRFDQRKCFDSSQIEAFAHGYAAQNFYLVQGPPGTGKTLVLAYLAVTLALEGQRVLVTALTHRAINNALRMIGKRTGFPHAFKVGQRLRALDLEWDGGTIRNYEKFEHSPYDPGEDGYIVGGTCFAVRSSRL
jgi:DNA replication ATP-dependent helicase Dna2